MVTWKRRLCREAEKSAKDPGALTFSRPETNQPTNQQQPPTSCLSVSSSVYLSIYLNKYFCHGYNVPGIVLRSLQIRFCLTLKEILSISYSCLYFTIQTDFSHQCINVLDIAVIVLTRISQLF